MKEEEENQILEFRVRTHVPEHWKIHEYDLKITGPPILVDGNVQVIRYHNEGYHTILGEVKCENPGWSWTVREMFLKCHNGKDALLRMTTGEVDDIQFAIICVEAVAMAMINNERRSDISTSQIVENPKKYPLISNSTAGYL